MKIALSPRPSSRPVIFVVRPVSPTRPMATRADLSPVTKFIAERIYDAPGSRLASSNLWRAWTRYAESLEINRGKKSELIAAVRKAYPAARIVKGLSGRDLHPGEPHLTGLWLR